MSNPVDTAHAALHGDSSVLAELAANLVLLQHDNLVERPWGGDWIRRFKGVGDAENPSAPRWGEAFEVSAFDEDAEAQRYPSRLRFDDGSTLDLPVLLKAHGDRLLGEAFLARHGACFPLLPKTLSVKELLSVQGHPPGNTEVYIIIDAAPGATLRLGFNQDLDATGLSRALSRGIAQQRELIESLGSEIDGATLQSVTAPWFADRDAGLSAAETWLERHGIGSATRSRAVELLSDLKTLYWQMLDSMNAIEVKPGQVIYNATPSRLLAETGGVPSAEVHALGNPEGREILALEIRRPGPTFRAWDNVRFPQREVDVDAAIEALNLRGSRPEEFICEPQSVAGRQGVWVSVASEFFCVEHLKPMRGLSVQVPASAPHSLHCLAGEIECFGAEQRHLGSLRQGQSAFVPVGVGAYSVRSKASAEVVRVTLPED